VIEKRERGCEFSVFIFFSKTTEAKNREKQKEAKTKKRGKKQIGAKHLLECAHGNVGRESYSSCLSKK